MIAPDRFVLAEESLPMALVCLRIALDFLPTVLDLHFLRIQ